MTVPRVRWVVYGRTDIFISSQGHCLVSRKLSRGDEGMDAVVMEGLVPGRGVPSHWDSPLGLWGVVGASCCSKGEEPTCMAVLVI